MNLTEEQQNKFRDFTKIVRNAAKCVKCGDIIESTFRHDFVTCQCGALSVDGGKDYMRRVGDFVNAIDLSEVRFWNMQEVEAEENRIRRMVESWARDEFYERRLELLAEYKRILQIDSEYN